MDLFPYFKSVLDQDRAPVVLCGMDHTNIYMNPAAGARYAKLGGMVMEKLTLVARSRMETAA